MFYDSLCANLHCRRIGLTGPVLLPICCQILRFQPNPTANYRKYDRLVLTLLRFCNGWMQLSGVIVIDICTVSSKILGTPVVTDKPKETRARTS